MGIRRHIPFVLLIAIAAAPLSVAAHDDDGDLEIVTLSNRADLISGGDALVEVSVPRRASLSRVEIKLNGRNITSAFQVVPGTRTLRGLVTGLVEGRNRLSADSHGAKEVQLTITNHRIGGPVLSGPQITPYFCATPTPQPATPTS